MKTSDVRIWGGRESLKHGWQVCDHVKQQLQITGFDGCTSSCIEDSRSYVSLEHILRVEELVNLETSHNNIYKAVGIFIQS